MSHTAPNKSPTNSSHTHKFGIWQLALFVPIAVSFQNTVPYFLILLTCMVITTPESIRKLVKRVENRAHGMQCFQEHGAGSATSVQFSIITQASDLWHQQVNGDLIKHRPGSKRGFLGSSSAVLSHSVFLYCLHEKGLVLPFQNIRVQPYAFHKEKMQTKVEICLLKQGVKQGNQ